MTRQYRIVYSREAVEDLKSIGRYISVELGSPKVAKNQLGRIRKAVGSLSTMPNRHPLIDSDPLAPMHLRRLIVDSYVVFYLVEGEKQRVSIVRIAYGGRDLTRLMGEVTPAE